MRNDPGERENVIEKPRCADVRRDLSARLEAFFGRYVDPRYDLWRGGRSKAGRILEETEA